MTRDMTYLIDLAVEAGHRIMEIYESDDFDIENKADDSPLTKADTASHHILKDGLTERFPDMPVISEEGSGIAYDDRRSWDRFWLVDPLDGTREFISRNGEFTVNIALIENRRPVCGVIVVPVTGTRYFANREDGAFRQDHDGMPVAIHTAGNGRNDALTVVQSRSHAAAAEGEFYSQYNLKDRVSRGSSLKFCMVAEGAADLYFRSGPTWEWDTAAGHAIVLHAGGKVLIGNDDLLYNKPSLKNDDGFLCAAHGGLLDELS